VSTVTALSGHALSLAVTVKVYGRVCTSPAVGVQQNLPVCSLSVGLIILKEALGIPLFQLNFTSSGAGVGAGGGV
jgi:hypothetical protein